MLLIGIIVNKTNQPLFSNILTDLGIALVTEAISAIIILFIISEDNDIKYDNEWGLEKIYRKRSEINTVCDEKLIRCSKNLDFISFGLKNFRNSCELIVKKKLDENVQIRILTINPDSKFVRQREIEEEAAEGSISEEIRNLIKWVNMINSESKREKISIKIYDSIPQFSLQRIDDSVFIGPNLYRVISQKCITYEYKKGGYGFDYFVDYFEKLWNDDSYSKEVVEGE